MKKAWPTVQLGEVLTPVERPEVPRPGTVYRQIGVKLWGVGAYERERLDGGATRYATLFRAEAGDVIVNKIWARNGSVAVVSDLLAGCYASAEFPMFSSNQHKLDPRWIHWLTKTPDFWAQCSEKSHGTSGQNRIRPEQFLEIRFPLPPLAEQRRVVARIEELAKQAYEAHRLQRETAQEAEALSGACIEANYCLLQHRVGCRRLTDVCETITDGDHNTPPFTDIGIRFIFVGNVSTGRLHFENCKRVDERYFRSLRPQRVPLRGDILYSAVGATLGIPAVVDTDEPFCFQRHVAILKPNRSLVDSQFVCHMLRSRTVFETAWRSTTGSAQPTVPLRSIRQLEIPAPPLADQRRIAADLDRLQAEWDAVKRLQAETAAHLAALLPTVLDRAFTGEL